MERFTHRLPAVVEGVELEVPCHYNTKQPWSLRFVAVVPRADGTRCERFHVARRLLSDGLIGPVGTRDVKVVPSNLWIELRFQQYYPDGFSLSVYLDRQALFDALTASYQLVPEGKEAEYMDWDEGLKAVGGVP